MQRSIQMRAKLHALRRYFAQLIQAEDLEAAGVRQQAAWPAHEAVQPAQAPHRFMPRPQIQVIRVAKNDLRAQRLQQVLRHGFD